MPGRFLVFLIGVFACALVVAPSTTALGPLITVKVSKQKDSGYGDVTKINVDKDETVSLWYRMKNVSPDDVKDVGFDDSDNKIPEDLSIKWFKGRTNISNDVRTDGYDFSLKQGKSKYFQAKIRADRNNIKHCVVGRGNWTDTFYEYAYGGVNHDCVT